MCLSCFSDVGSQLFDLHHTWERVCLIYLYRSMCTYLAMSPAISAYASTLCVFTSRRMVLRLERYTFIVGRITGRHVCHQFCQQVAHIGVEFVSHRFVLILQTWTCRCFGAHCLRHVSLAGGLVYHLGWSVTIYGRRGVLEL